MSTHFESNFDPALQRVNFSGSVDMADFMRLELSQFDLSLISTAKTASQSLLALEAIFHALERESRPTFMPPHAAPQGNQ